MKLFTAIALVLAILIAPESAYAASPWFSGYLNPANNYRYYGFSDWDTLLFGGGIQPDSSLLGVSPPSHRVDGHVVLEADGTGFAKVAESTGSYAVRSDFAIGTVYPVSFQFSNWWSNPGTPPISDTRGDFNSQFINIVSGPVGQVATTTINVSGSVSGVVISTGSDWKTATQSATGWNTNTAFDDSGWSNATVPGIVLPNTIWHPSWSSTAFFRKVVELPEGTSTGYLETWFDDDGEVFINGTRVINDYSGSSANYFPNVDVSAYLQSGRNLIAAKGVDYIGNKLFAAKLTARASGTQTQGQAGYATLSGAMSLAKTGLGTLVLNAANTLTGSTSVQAGRLQLAHPSALASSRLVPLAGGTVTLSPGLQTTVGGLAPNAGGRIDVGTGLVTVAAGLASNDLVTALVTGMGDGSWNGTSGITSTAAASSEGSRTVGWLDNGDGSMTLGYAAPGDTNLDWIVDSLDLANFLSSGKLDSGMTATWSEGDSNYDGLLDVLDAAGFLSSGLLDSGMYNTPAGSIAAVPEPATSAIAVSSLCVGAVSLWRRRKRA